MERVGVRARVARRGLDGERDARLLAGRVEQLEDERVERRAAADDRAGAELVLAELLLVDARLVGVALATMEPAWEPVMLGDVSRSGVTVDGDTAFVGDRTGTLHAVDVATGQMRWTAEVGGPIDMSPAAGGGLVLVATRATPNPAPRFTGARPAHSPYRRPTPPPGTPAVRAAADSKKCCAIAVLSTASKPAPDSRS